MIFTTCTSLGWVDATIADRCELTLAKVDAVDGVAQVIANVTPHVAHAHNKYSCIHADNLLLCHRFGVISEKINCGTGDLEVLYRQ